MKEGVENAFLLLKDKIRSTHVHDNDGVDDTHRFPGSGTIDWKRAMELMRGCGDQFPLLLELKEQPDMGNPLDAVREVFDRLENQ
jgi:sugar phosphate isomerase/epimerase